jgi:ATP:corrinoid adenosyltransferase
MIHLYCGDGKGKTTAAVGLAVRAAGSGMSVLFVQFMKPGRSSEMPMLEKLGVKCRFSPVDYGFYKNMTPEQREEMRGRYTALLRSASEEAERCGLVVLDEIVSAFRHGLVEPDALLALLDRAQVAGRPELVLTGRDPAEELLARADYITRMEKERHPFDRGIRARRGIEF